MVVSALHTRKDTVAAAFSRRPYTIKPREPWELPTQTEEIPAPSRPPQAPGQLNLLTMILPPVLMMAAYGAVIAFMSKSGSSSGSFGFFLIMPLVGLGMPIANYISHRQQVKKYQQTMQEREQNYRAALAKTRARLEALAKQQREALDREYPLLPRLVQTGLGISHQKRLWWRRMADLDFLSLRMGTGRGPASFKVNPPRTFDPEDPLAPLALELAEEYKEVSNIPLLLDLLKVGSVGLEGKGEGAIYGFARRLILDILVHHSPQDVQIAVLADTPQAQDRWEWLKWAPHTRAIYQGESLRRLAFSAQAIDRTMEWLMDEFEGRRRSEPGVKKRKASAAIFVLLDDSGDIRRTEDIRQLAESGRDADIYLMFVGGRNWPRECRAKINVSDGEFKYTETFAGEGGGGRLRGQIEPASQLDCERLARVLAGWEISSGGGSSALPETVRLSDLFENQEIVLDGLRQNWKRSRDRDELLQFPFGLRSGRKGLEPVILNLLPPAPEFTGIGAYHTILVGTTGSGKSEFMKSLVLSAAWKYSPNLLNFFFMDFKGGAAFNVLKDLPHVVGVVTNLSPQLVERGLDALEAEFDRRQKRFAEAAVANIWAYNEKFPQTPIPHLMLLLDEFARGMSDFQRLPEMLDKLVRIGRSLGVYLLLANQDVNSAVDRLLNNVGWHIALKVARQEEMYVIDRSLPKVERTGQGYLHSMDGDIYEFQAAYAGFPVADREESAEQIFRIYHVGEDGKWHSPFTNARRPSVAEKERSRPSEQDHLISFMKEVSGEVEAAPLIYLEPLEKNITLETVLQESGIQRAFVDGKWERKAERARLVAPIGYTDSTEACVQDPLVVDFEDQDGHLWFIGGPSSGKTMSLETTLLSLALTNTPEEAQFYILEFSAEGRLKTFQSLPHCGAVITPKDPPELVDRLFRYLDEEMNRRSDKKGRGKKGQSRDADIFLVIHDFNEFRTAYPDHVDRLSPFIKSKAMGIHLIVSTNRRIELPNKLGIARKAVLRLTNRDDYSDAVGGRVTIPATQAEGRGLWVDGKPLECQIAQPVVSLEAGESLTDLEAACQSLAKKWRGASAPQIRVLPKEISLDDLLKQTALSKGEGLSIPLGLSFETAQLVAVDLLKEIPRWLIVGPPRSGKSNFLACLANAIAARQPGQWDICYVSPRRAAPAGLNKEASQLASTPAEAVATIEKLLASFDQSPKLEKRVLLLLDDLGAAFEPGRETFAAALNSLALKVSSRDDIIIAGAGLPDELRPHQMMSKLVQSLKTSKNGIGFSRDSNDVELLGYSVPLQYRRMELPPGRGFWVSGNRAVLIQTPIVVMEQGARK
ncbi:MAG: ESX secretion system protein EccC [Gammaproteobacteria bacterium]|nr:ESX secretion system protein EccC [Gammaproteobacteria bacterium]